MRRTDLDADPFVQFEAWFSDAKARVAHQPEAMTLATATPDAFPSARTVLLKDVSKGGFVFFTNAKSRKGHELAQNPHAALLFWWRELKRQVRIEGVVTRVSESDADEYFASRARASQLGAWASDQSAVIGNRDELARRVTDFSTQFEGEDVPRPPHWCGYRLIPHTFEFWQDREARLHDRFRYRRSNGSWVIERLAP